MGKYQAKFFENLKNNDNAEWSGDGRFDSMGHNAKYRVYAMFCNNILRLLHFQLMLEGLKERRGICL